MQVEAGQADTATTRSIPARNTIASPARDIGGRITSAPSGPIALRMKTLNDDGNGPLNNALAAVGGNGPEAGVVWARYLSDWTAWNHVRTVTSALATGLFIYAIAAR